MKGAVGGGRAQVDSRLTLWMKPIHFPGQRKIKVLIAEIFLKGVSEMKMFYIHRAGTMLSLREDVEGGGGHATFIFSADILKV